MKSREAEGRLRPGAMNKAMNEGGMWIWLPSLMGAVKWVQALWQRARHALMSARASASGRAGSFR